MSLERDRVEHFRQRWAQENYGPPPQDVETRAAPEPRRQDGLNEVAAPPPVEPSSRSTTPLRRPHKKQSKQSWRGRNPFTRSGAPHDRDTDNEQNLTEVAAPPPFQTDRRRSRYLEDEETALPSPQSLDEKSPIKQPAKDPPIWLTELYTISYLIFFALLGVLARLGIEAITEYPNAPVTSRVLWANLGGSFIMGFLSEDRRLFEQPSHLNRHLFKRAGKDPSTQPLHDREHHPSKSEIVASYSKFKKTIPVYVGLATGFCGSFTSFSSFIRDAFLALTNDLQSPSLDTPYQAVATVAPRNGGFSFEAVVAILILHPAISLAALQTGAQFALLLDPILRPVPTRLFTKFINPLMVPLSILLWLALCLPLSIVPPYAAPVVINWRSRAMFPLLFAPPGCLLRYYFSKYFNPVRPSFPLGTFCANIFATLVIGMCFDLQHAGWMSGNGCAVLVGVEEGFCGCLSTVSTWVTELDTLKRRHAWIYGGVSVGLGLVSLIIITGSVGWTVGFSASKCG